MATKGLIIQTALSKQTFSEALNRRCDLDQYSERSSRVYESVQRKMSSLHSDRAQWAQRIMLREKGVKNKQKRCSDREQCFQKLQGASSNQRCQGVMRKKDIPEKCVLKAFKNKSLQREFKEMERCSDNIRRLKVCRKKEKKNKIHRRDRNMFRNCSSVQKAFKDKESCSKSV